MNSKINILGVKIDNFNLQEVWQKIRFFLFSEKQHYLVTVNPEFVVEAQKDEKFKNILNEADLSVPDGFGLMVVARLFKIPFKERIVGVDLVWDIVKIAEQQKCSVLLLGGKDGSAKKSAEILKQKYPQLKIKGISGGVINSDKSNPGLVQQINNFQPNILLVALGQVKQEKWIFNNIKKIPSVKLAVGVGGSLDFISGASKRAPRLMRRIGLEWLWRLIMEPWRIKRIYNAVIKFSWLVLANKIRGENKE